MLTASGFDPAVRYTHDYKLFGVTLVGSEVIRVVDLTCLVSMMSSTFPNFAANQQDP